MPSKIHVLEGSWLGKSYQDQVLPILTKEKVPVVRERLIPISDLHSANQWASLRNEVDNIDIAVLDYHHWYYDDNMFYQYIQQVANCKFSSVCIFEHPYGWERPRNVDLYSFEKKLSDRTKLVCKLLRLKSPNTKLVSPAIRVLDADIQKRYLNYFIQHRYLFDIYAVHCCTEITDHSLGALSSFLNQVLKMLTKTVWITRWSVPSCDDKIISSQIVQATEWDQISTIEASAKLKTMYKIINEVTSGHTNWFFTGVGKDMYHPAKQPPDIWNVNRTYLSDEVSSNWQPEHFIGAITHDNKIKHQIINSFLELFHAHS